MRLRTDAGYMVPLCQPSTSAGLWLPSSRFSCAECALDVVIPHPVAVNEHRLGPARGLDILGISHAPGDIEHRFDIVLPGLALVNALLVDTKRFIHLHGL